MGGMIPELVAHRGDCTAYPENSLPALASALRQGVRRVEFDVQLSADRVPVLLHDADLARVAGVPRRIFELSAAAAARIALTGGDGRAGVPGLESALELLDAHPGARAFVEIKEESLDHFGLTAVLDAIVPLVEHRHEQLVVISFSDDCLEALHERCAVPRGWVLNRCDPASLARARSLAPQYLFADWHALPPDVPLWQGPWQWAIYEVDTAELALELGRRGARLVESFRAVELARDPRLAGPAQP